MSFVIENMRLPRRDGVRRVACSGHSLSYEGYFHGWTRTEDDRLAAVIESGGRVRVERDIHLLEFAD